MEGSIHLQTLKRRPGYHASEPNLSNHELYSPAVNANHLPTWVSGVVVVQTGFSELAGLFPDRTVTIPGDEEGWETIEMTARLESDVHHKFRVRCTCTKSKEHGRHAPPNHNRIITPQMSVKPDLNLVVGVLLGNRAWRYFQRQYRNKGGRCSL
jgi:hypothetical protein